MLKRPKGLRESSSGVTKKTDNILYILYTLKKLKEIYNKLFCVIHLVPKH